MEKIDQYHLDANESAFFKGQLEYIKTGTYDVKYAPNKALGLFPVSTEAGAAATEIVWRSFSKVGLARLVSDYSQDFPRVDIYGTENRISLHDIGASYGYSIQEIRRAQKAGLPLESRRAATCRDAIDNKLNDIVLNGDASANIEGFLDYPGIIEFTITSGVAGNTWAKKTADEILADMNGIVEGILTTTNGIEAPDTMLLPLAKYLLITRKRISDDSDGKTVMKYFLENNVYIKRIEWLTELEDAGYGGSARMMVFANDLKHLSLELPVPFEQFDADKKALAYEIPCLARTGGIIIYYPLSVSYVDGI